MEVCSCGTSTSINSFSSCDTELSNRNSNGGHFAAEDMKNALTERSKQPEAATVSEQEPGSFGTAPAATHYVSANAAGACDDEEHVCWGVHECVIVGPVSPGREGAKIQILVNFGQSSYTVTRPARSGQ